MANYIVITENDESQWDDQTGVKYHYPPKYKGKIKEGTIVVYYKGRIKDVAFQTKRLSNEPHYFGTGVIGNIEQESGTKNYFATILDFKLFNEAVGFKEISRYLELKANDFKGNYFRGNGVRDLTKEEYDNILSKASLLDQKLIEPYAAYEESHTSNVSEGKKVAVYTTKYERSKTNRDKALKIHGYSCCICGINFKDKYGDLGEGFIHVHHVKPLYELDAEVVIDPVNDLVPVCPNCHAIIHRRKNNVISIDEMKQLYKK
jgi:putative restriction endonuclease